jgi:CubicO group peptidase (beta-lactamase class C family)
MEIDIMNRYPLGLVALLLVAVCTGCLVDPELKVPFAGSAPEELNDGWELSMPEAEGLNSAEIEEVYRRLFSEDLFPTVRSLLIVRHGKLVAEGYSRDLRDRHWFHNVQSVTKSVTSLLVGIAMREGLLETLDTPLYAVIPEYFDDDPRKRSITLRDVLTMRTGLRFHNDDDSGVFVHSPGSSVRNILHRPLEFDPGSTFYYNDGTPQLVAGLLMEAAGVTLEEYAREHLFGPLGIDNLQWEKHGDGLSFGAYGLWLRPRDLARIGQLMLQGGSWEGQQVVPPEWIVESTRVHANGDYGYYWWVMDENRVYRASGAGGQIIFVDEGSDLVIVLTGDPASKSWILSQGIDSLFTGILEAVESP